MIGQGKGSRWWIERLGSKHSSLKDSHASRLRNWLCVESEEGLARVCKIRFIQKARVCKGSREIDPNMLDPKIVPLHFSYALPTFLFVTDI